MSIDSEKRVAEGTESTGQAEEAETSVPEPALDYDRLIVAFSLVSISMLPGLLAELIRACVRRQVFKGVTEMRSFINRIIELAKE